METSKKHVLIILVVLLLALLFFTASVASNSNNKVYLPVQQCSTCTASPPSETWSQAERAYIENVVSDAGKVAPLDEDRHDITTSSLDQDDYRYTYEKHDVVDNIDSVLYLGLNDDVIWPGNLVEGNKAHDFVYDPVTLPRQPIEISVSLESSCTGPSITHTVVDPKLSTMRQGISDLLEKAIVDCTHVPAKVDFKYEQVTNTSQMSLFTEADVRYGAGSLDAKFNWDSVTHKNKIMARYRQIYFSIDVDTPVSPADLFDPLRTTLGDITTALPPGSMPMYVSGVNYGMMALMFIETNFSYEQMQLALNAAYSTGVIDVDLGFGYTAREVLSSSIIQIVVYGGSTKGLGELETGMNGFLKVIEASKDFTEESPGVPLVYKFRHLKDNTLALITLTSQYTLVKPLQINQRVKIQVVYYQNMWCDDEGLDNDVDIDRWFFWVNGWNRTSDTDPGVLVNIPDDPQGSRVVYKAIPGEWETCYGQYFLGDEYSLTFSTEPPYDFTVAKMILTGYARDYDGSGSDEHAWGDLTLLGNSFYGTHDIHIISADFGGYYHVNLLDETPPPNPPPAP